MIKFALCDDNPQLVSKLQEMLEKIFLKHDFDASVVFSSCDASSLLSFLNTNDVDVLFLDIDLNSSLNGIQLAKEIRKKNKSVYIVFATGHFEYIVSAFECKTFDFLQKPFSMSKLENTIVRLYDDINNNSANFIKLNSRNTLINQNSINYIQKNGMKTIFNVVSGEINTYGSFNTICSSLPSNFVRCHKSFIVNTLNISEIDFRNNIIFFKNMQSAHCFIGPKYKNSFMEVLNNIWLSMTTENEMLTKIIGLPFIFIEVTISMLLFTSILRISASKKQKIIYILITSFIGIICSAFIPKPYSNIITLIAMPITVMLVFKVSILKALFAEFLPTICIVVSEIIIARIFLLIFSTDYATCANIPFYRLIINLSIYAFLFGIYKLIQYLKFNINMLDHISIKSKHTLIVNAIIAVVVIFIQMYLIGYYNDKLPTFIILINIISLVAYFTISIYSLVKTMKLEKTTADLEQEKLYNKTLQILHDNVRAFKHDFSNIIAGIGGYIATKDMDGLERYYKQLLQDCNQVNNLSSLSPDSINNPAVYTVLANKYYKADSLGIKINLETFVDFNSLHMGIYEFTRVLGILMDNAIEAASECAKKIINVIIRNDVQCNRQLLIIENTYNNKDVDIDRLSEKGYSTKPNNTGLGLWEVNKIIKRHKNLACFTSKTPEYFKQQFEIYNE